MKKALLMVALIACLASCKKDKFYIPTLNGTWELRSISGGFGPGTVLPPGKGDRYKITINSRYVKTDTNKVETRGNFTVKFTEERGGYRFGTITFTNPAYTDAFKFKPDTMYIGSSAADGPTYQYIKIK